MKDVFEKIGKTLSESDIQVIFEGATARTDGKTITLPSFQNIDEKTFLKLRGYIDHEVGHVKHSDFGVLVDITSKDLKNLVNVIEDIRIEKLMSEQFIGSKTNFECLLNLLLEKRDINVEHPLNALMLEGKRQVCGYNLNLPDLTGYVKSYFKNNDIFQQIEACQSTADVVELAKKLLSDLSEDDAGDDDVENDSGSGEGGDTDTTDDKNPDDNKSDTDGDDSDGDDTDGDDSDGDDTDGDDSDGDDTDGDDTDGDDTGRSSEGESSGDIDNVDAVFDGDSDGGENTKIKIADKKTTDDKPIFPDYEDIYGELQKEIEEQAKLDLTNSDYTIYSTSYDKFVKVKEARNTKLYKDILSKVGSLQQQKMKIANLFLSEKFSKWELGKKQGKINNASIAKIKAGATDVFKIRKEAKQVNTSISILVDFSGSMRWQDKIQQAMSTLVVLSEIFNYAKVNFEILGFTTYGRKKTEYFTDEEFEKAASIIDKCHPFRPEYSRYSPIVIYCMKDFNEPFSVKIKNRISNYKSISLEHNVDGESVEIAYKRLLNRPEKRKILFVLSDGTPEADGDKGALKKHLKKVTSKIEQEKKVELYGIGILTDSVRDYYSKYMVVKKVDDLTVSIVNKLQEILK